MHILQLQLNSCSNEQLAWKIMDPNVFIVLFRKQLTAFPPTLTTKQGNNMY